MYCLKNAEQGYLDIFEGSKSIFFKFCAWFLKAYSMEPVHDIIFFEFFDVQTLEKGPLKNHAQNNKKKDLDPSNYV